MRTAPDKLSVRVSSVHAESTEKIEQFAVLTITGIDSKKVVLKDSNDHPLTIGNSRMCDDIEISNLKNIESIESMLSRTEYVESIPSKSDNTERMYPFAISAIVLKAYLAERNRMDNIAVRVMKDVQRYMSDKTDTGGTILQHRLENIFREANASWTRKLAESSTANHLPKLFDIHHLRADRRAAVQLMLLAKGKSNERRWPGYPSSERDKRDDIPITTVKSSLGNLPPRMIKHIQVKWEDKMVKQVHIIFEDNPSTETFPSTGEYDNKSNRVESDEGLQKHLGKLAEQNQMKFQHALMRAKEEGERKTNFEETYKDAVIASINNILITKMHNSKNVELGPNEVVLCFDVSKNTFHPPSSRSVQSIRNDHVNRKIYRVQIKGSSDEYVRVAGNDLITYKYLQQNGLRIRPYGLSEMFPDWKFYPVPFSEKMYRVRVQTVQGSGEELIHLFGQDFYKLKHRDNNNFWILFDRTSGKKEQSILVPKQKIKLVCDTQSLEIITSDPITHVLLTPGEFQEHFT
jgi:hypothetical protein